MLRFTVVLDEVIFTGLVELADRERTDVRTAAAQLIETGLRRAGVIHKTAVSAGGGTDTAGSPKSSSRESTSSLAQSRAGATRRPGKANRAAGNGSIRVSSRTGDEIAHMVRAIVAPSTDGGDDARV